MVNESAPPRGFPGRLKQHVRQTLHLGLRGDQYLIEIECLRGVAVSLVFVFHCWGILGNSATIPDSLPTVIAATGNTGVTLFFVLSGFLLFQPWARYLLNLTSNPPSLLRYAAARSLRILPLYYAVLLISALHLRTWEHLLPAATFQMLGFRFFPYSAVWWTLITEVQFYLVLPLAGWLLMRGRAGRFALAAVLGLWLLLYLNLVALADEPIEGFALTKSLFARAPAFLFGMLIAVALDLPDMQKKLNGRVRVLLLLLACAGLLALLNAVAQLDPRAAETEWPGHHIGEALLWTLVVVAITNGRDAFRLLRFLELPLALVGKLSYSVYLLHVPILFYLLYPLNAKDAPLAQQLALTMLGAGLTLLASLLTYVLIERPALGLKERLRF